MCVRVCVCVCTADSSRVGTLVALCHSGAARPSWTPRERNPPSHTPSLPSDDTRTRADPDIDPKGAGLSGRDSSPPRRRQHHEPPACTADGRQERARKMRESVNWYGTPNMITQRP
jgi:hypothetical protein